MISCMASIDSDTSISGWRFTAMPMMKSSPTARRMRRMISEEKRVRFSRLPPQRSSRRVDQGMIGGKQLDAVEARGSGAAGGSEEALDHLLDLDLAHAVAAVAVMKGG